MKQAYEIIGKRQVGGVLIVCDHASNFVPNDVILGIDPELLNQHIAWDIGVAAIARYLVHLSDYTAFLATHSRLVTDLNRYPNDDSAIPEKSDGVDIPGNYLDIAGRQARLEQFFTPYHLALEHHLNVCRPDLILSIHSFTPRLETDPLAIRPWEIGILYNEQDAPCLIAIDYLERENIIVGDQLPYSGRVLNATMNRHAEANDIPYVGIEIRQDLIGDAAGQERFAALFAEMAQYIVERLASGPVT